MKKNKAIDRLRLRYVSFAFRPVSTAPLADGTGDNVPCYVRHRSGRECYCLGTANNGEMFIYDSPRGKDGNE